MRACPTKFGLYDERPEATAGMLAEFADAGLVNIVGGCCGTTPAHIRAIAEAVAGKKPREKSVKPKTWLRLSGPRALHAHRRTSPSSMWATVKRNQRHRLGEIPQAESPMVTTDTALDVARDQVANGAQVIDVNMDEGLLDSEKAIGGLPQLGRRGARYSRAFATVNGRFSPSSTLCRSIESRPEYACRARRS